MSQKETVASWLKTENIDLSNVDWPYDINGEKKVLVEKDVLEATIKRLSEDRVVNVFKEFKDYFENKWWDREKSDPKVALRKEIGAFLHNMAEYSLWVGHKDTTMKKLAKDCEMELEFLEWWRKEKGLTLQQMLCDHDDTDQFAEDGRWYNSVGKCRKCLVSTNETLDYDDSVDLVYKAWKRK